jgi:hypothetical protein
MSPNNNQTIMPPMPPSSVPSFSEGNNLNNNKMVINDHFQMDLRRLNGNMNGAPGFYQRASCNMIYKKTNQCEKMHKNENDQWHPILTSTGPKFSSGHSPCTYGKRNLMKITKRANYVVKTGHENDQWNGITSTSRPVSHANGYQSAVMKKITKKANMKNMKLSKLESDQWTQMAQSAGYNMALPVQECGVYNKANRKVIMKSKNMKNMKLAPMESDQWHPSVSKAITIKTNRYHKVEERKANKPWHLSNTTENEVAQQPQPKLMDHKKMLTNRHSNDTCETGSNTTDDDEDYNIISMNEVTYDAMNGENVSPGRNNAKIQQAGTLTKNRFHQYQRTDSKGNLATSVSQEAKSLSEVGRTGSNNSLSKLNARTQQGTSRSPLTGN